MSSGARSLSPQSNPPTHGPHAACFRIGACLGRMSKGMSRAVARVIFFVASAMGLAPRRAPRASPPACNPPQSDKPPSGSQGWRWGMLRVAGMRTLPSSSLQPIPAGNGQHLTGDERRIIPSQKPDRTRNIVG